jgi:UDP-N-acetylglucosamine 2-epimerase (non-hydrolysing)
VDPQSYALLTLHRPANVDDAVVLERLLRACIELSRELPVVFPLHPRTRRQIENAGFAQLLQSAKTMSLYPPLGYLHFVHLMAHARMVLTDSGGVQEESTALGVPCLTLREETERPVTVTEGTNVIVGSDVERIRTEAGRILRGQGRAGRIPDRWDGHAAERIAALLVDAFFPGAYS